jgi:CubicO group peptidase (beta-lactamase class C family)
MKNYLLQKNFLKTFFTGIALSCFFILSAQEANLAGKWKGAIKVPGMELSIVLEFQKEKNKWKGDLDIPVQRIIDMKLDELVVEGNNISFKLPEVPGNAHFKGGLEADGRRILGDFMQGGATLVLEAKRENATDKKELLDKIARIKELSSQVMERTKVPGLGFGIIKDGEILMAEGFGFKNVATKEKVDANTLFAIGSSSKAFTTMGLALLEDDGLLDWEAPVKSYIPEFEMMDDFASKEMNAVDLVCHRSGLPRHDLLWYGSDFSRDELLKRIKYLEPSEAFRTKFQYQNLMFLTAGVLTERLSNKTWESFIGNRVFRTLGMDESNFSVSRMKEHKNHAKPHRQSADKVSIIPFRNIDAIGPAGSINSNVNEMLKWVQMHLNNGKIGQEQLVSKENLQKMHRPHMVIEQFPGLNFPQFRNPSYGLGWFVYNYEGTQVVQHGGNIDGFSALVYLLPEENIGMVLLTNLNGNPAPLILSNYATDILLEKEETDWLKLVLGDEKEEDDKDEAEEETETEENRVKDTQPSHALKDYAGTYMHSGYGTVAIKLENKQLTASYNAFDMKMTHWHYDVFQGKIEEFDTDVPFQFEMDLEGNIVAVNIPLDQSVAPIRFEKQAPNKLKNPVFLEKLVGEYQTDKLLLKVKREGKKLVLSPAGQPNFNLIPYKGTSFKAEGLSGYIVEFVLDKDEVKEMILRQPNGVFTAKRK